MSSKTVKILVVYYSTYGNVFQLAKSMSDGAKNAGAEVKLVRVPELVPESVIEGNPGMKAGREVQKGVPVATLEDLEWADGVAFGSPTRFGNMAAQLKNYLDQTGGLWAKGALVGKPATFFTGSATMHGGQESTLLTMMIPLLHHGMVILGVPYTIPEISSTVKGGGPYGASVLVGPKGDQGVDETELKIAFEQGKRLAETAKKLQG